MAYLRSGARPAKIQKSGRNPLQLQARYPLEPRDDFGRSCTAVGQPASAERLPEPPERQQGSGGLRLQLAPTRPRAPREVPTDIGARLIGAAEEVPRDRLDVQRAAMAILHAHVGAILIEPDELRRSSPQPSVIVAGNPHVVAEQREAAGAARQALGNDRQTRSLPGSDAPVTPFLPPCLARPQAAGARG